MIKPKSLEDYNSSNTSRKIYRKLQETRKILLIRTNSLKLSSCKKTRTSKRELREKSSSRQDGFQLKQIKFKEELEKTD